MTYLETRRYLESFFNYEKTGDYPQPIKLERMKGFLERIGNPQDECACLHIAGTKGKGSTCAFIAYILRRAGFRAGLYTSPHLSDPRERLRVLIPGGGALPVGDFEGMITEDAFAGLLTDLRPAIDTFNRGSLYGALTFFEVYTAAAFEYFRRAGVDFVALETGLGGRLDATNTVSALACGLTQISYDHTAQLGNTLRQIAGEKAGIIKACLSKKAGGQPIVVSAPQEPEAEAVIRQACGDAGARFYEVGRDIICEGQESGFTVRGIFERYDGLNTRLLGGHQLVNAAVAVGLVESLRERGVTVSADAIRGGIADTLWPLRCEVFGRNPAVILDGAHNIASCRALKDVLGRHFSYKRLILILGISRDKDVAGICAEMGAGADLVIVTRADSPRACPPEDIAALMRGKNVMVTGSVNEARARAYAEAGPDDAIVVCGSLFVAGEFKYGSA